MSDFMPEEVVIQILTRLPPKSLLRFRCVSKSWKSLISSPQFVNKQTRRSFLSKPPSPPPRVLLRYHSKDQHSEVYSVHHNNETFGVDNDVKELLPFLAPKNIVIATPGIKRYYLRIVGSSNRLLCLSDDMLTQTDVIILWNPSIRRKITLPLPRRSMGPWGLLCAIGFGYDIKNNDFKVVRIAYVEDKKDGKDGYVLPPIVEIFSPSGGNWREIGGNVPRAWVIEYFCGQAFVNGKLHWTAYRRKSAGRVGERENLILVFDLSDEVFQEMPLPNVLLNESPINMETAVYEESISVLHYDARVQSRHCSIWVMKEYGNADSWIKMFHVDVGGLGLVLGFRKTGDILLALECGELVSYDPKTRGTDSLGIFGTKCSFYTDAYTESLALLSEGQQEVADLRNASKSGCSDVNIEEEVDDKVELSELWKQAIMIKYLNALLERQFT